MSGLLATPKGDITIRAAVPDDAALLRELRIEALATHPQAFGSDVASAQARSVEWWVESIRNYAPENTGAIQVASWENQLIGMVGIVRETRPKTRHNGTMWGVFVKADWRGLRVADALVNACLTWAQTHGLLAVRLSVITTNTSAIRCYVRCGFSVYGVDPKVLFYDSVYYDELLMVKQIAPDAALHSH